MTELLIAAQMRAIERAAIDSGEVTGLELMERAGRGVVDAIFARWPDLRAALVLCGPGNNGGDGFVIARLLVQAGWRVQVAAMRSPEAMRGDAAVNAKRWAGIAPAIPYTVEALTDAAHAAVSEGIAEWVVVDALFGIGQHGPLDAALAPLYGLVDATFARGAGPVPRFVAVDVPTGYDPDTGDRLCNWPAPVDLAIAFHSAKPVHAVLSDAEVIVVGIGL